jgi:hypothetical protein
MGLVEKHLSLYNFYAFEFNYIFFNKDRRRELAQSVKVMVVRSSGTKNECYEQID